MRWFRLLAPVLLLVAACGRSHGEPAGADAVPAPAPDSAAPSSTAAELAVLDPCALLSAADRSTAGLTVPGERRSIGGAAACDYTEPGSFGVTVTVDGTSGLADLDVPGDAEPISIGGHDALRVADPAADDGTCAVLVAAGESASVHVDVSRTDFTGTEDACRRAMTVAELVAPDLPGGAG
ncbi:DUF3558 family protein [Prauserella oleivorans]|uniref:DUF3558 family protein n=1 Tax=Prauserella oleivorans TaxID=1478153 RepID=A0ABW5W692_9PSEU